MGTAPEERNLYSYRIQIRAQLRRSEIFIATASKIGRSSVGAKSL
jgi:hypothetical protein